MHVTLGNVVVSIAGRDIPRRCHCEAVSKHLWAVGSQVSFKNECDPRRNVFNAGKWLCSQSRIKWFIKAGISCMAWDSQSNRCDRSIHVVPSRGGTLPDQASLSPQMPALADLEGSSITSQGLFLATICLNILHCLATILVLFSSFVRPCCLIPDCTNIPLTR